MLIFVERGKPENPEKNPPSKAMQCHRAGLIEIGLIWWETSAFNTPPCIRAYYLFYMLPYDFAFAHCNYKEWNAKTILGTQLLTTSLSVEPNPHGDMTVPRDWMEPDIFRVESSLKSVRHVAIAVPISCEYLY